MKVEKITKIILDPVIEYKSALLLSEDERFMQTSFSTTGIVFENVVPCICSEKDLVTEVLPNLDK